MTEREQTEHMLTCVECAAEAPPDAQGWQAHLTVGDEHAEDVAPEGVVRTGAVL